MEQQYCQLQCNVRFLCLVLRGNSLGCLRYFKDLRTSNLFKSFIHNNIKNRTQCSSSLILSLLILRASSQTLLILRARSLYMLHNIICHEPIRVMARPIRTNLLRHCLTPEYFAGTESVSNQFFSCKSRSVRSGEKG